MQNKPNFNLPLLLILLLSTATHAAKTHINIKQGPTNSVIIQNNKANLIIYGDPTAKITSPDLLLLTDLRRDIASSAQKIIDYGVKTLIPAQDSNPSTFWTNFTQNRYHDYAQQTTKILTTPIKNPKTVKDGDKIKWQDITITVVNTTGYTKNAVSYLTEIDNRKYAFTGDLIYGNGQIMDLYSLQDTIPEANIRGYHGWAGRISKQIISLRKIATYNPDIIVPARGPIINNPQKAIKTLINRLQTVYKNYLSINAGKWYFKENYDKIAQMALGSDQKVPWMPWAVEINKTPPEWIIPISNTRLIISTDGTGFLIDCGSQNIINKLIQLRNQGTLKNIEGLFITHYHDDHTDAVNDLQKEFPCPVYACDPLVDILKNPSAYRLPAMTNHPITKIKTKPIGSKMKWKEYTFTFYDFPGQTIYHDALLVQKPNEVPIFFIGDSFTPSGIDDYCLLNRNILQKGTGYFQCLDIIRKVPESSLLINQHVMETFRFAPEQLDHMENTLIKRIKLMNDLFPFDNANYGIDERWVRFYPYGQKTKPNSTITLSAIILNHSNKPKTFKIHPNTPPGLTVTPTVKSITVPPQTEKQTQFQVTIGNDIKAGVHVITADIEFDNHKLMQWTESLIEIEE